MLHFYITLVILTIAGIVISRIIRWRTVVERICEDPFMSAHPQNARSQNMRGRLQYYWRIDGSFPYYVRFMRESTSLFGGGLTVITRAVKSPNNVTTQITTAWRGRWDGRITIGSSIIGIDGMSLTHASVARPNDTVLMHATKCE